MVQRYLFIFILVTIGFANAQTYNDRSSVLEIGYGLSAPLGKFESSEISDSASGYATAGTNLNVMFTYLINKNVGVSAMISSSVNRLFTTGIKDRYQAYADKIDGVVSDIYFEKWSTTGYMAGGYLTFPLQKASFNMKLLLGYARTNYPDVNATIYSDLDSNAVEVHQYAPDVASAFCFNAGAGLKYDISELMCLCVNVNFLSTYPEFKEVITTSTFQSSTDDEIHQVHQRVSLLNATAGVGFRF